MLLNQQNPEKFARTLTYYDYLSQARLEQLKGFNETLRQLANVEAEINLQQAQLLSQKSSLDSQRAELDNVRKERQQVLAKLNSDVKDRDQKLQARAHPSAHALTRAVGASEQLTLEVIELEVYPGDAFLLCSDGLYQGLSSDALGNALSLTAPHIALERLFDSALQGSARDNLTAVVIRQ